MAKGRWQIAPRRAGAHPLQDRLQKQTIVFCRCSGIAELTWKMRPKPLPQDVRHHKPLLVHSNLYFGSLNEKSNPMAILNAHGTYKINYVDRKIM